jgi:hypothetical protein
MERLKLEIPGLMAWLSVGEIENRDLGCINEDRRHSKASEV